jgi:hypothetical protein
MVRPLGLPWATFAALLLIFASVLLSVIWAALGMRRDRSGGRAHDE